MPELLKPPPDYEEIGCIGDGLYSNLDHELNEEMVQRLDTEKATAPHYAWNFYGLVWKDHATGQWHEMVKVNRMHVETFSSGSARGVIDLANAKYGSE